MASQDEESKNEEDGSSDMPQQKRKRETSESDYDDEDYFVGKEEVAKFSSSESPSDPDAPRVANGIVDFNLSSLVVHFTCSLCEGLFKDPITITECLHSFCKSCIFLYFSSGNQKCPTCEMFLGPDPYKYALNDRTMQSLGDKVLFPSVKERDELDEKAFYVSRGILPIPDTVEGHADSRTENPEPIAEVSRYSTCILT